MNSPIFHPLPITIFFVGPGTSVRSASLAQSSAAPRVETARLPTQSHAPSRTSLEPGRNGGCYPINFRSCDFLSQKSWQLLRSTPRRKPGMNGSKRTENSQPTFLIQASSIRRAAKATSLSQVLCIRHAFLFWPPSHLLIGISVMSVMDPFCVC